MGELLETIRVPAHLTGFIKIREVAAGIKYLHEEYVIHGDIRGVSYLSFHPTASKLKRLGQYIH